MLRILKQLKNIKGKHVLLRVDFNVPIDKRGVVDDTRIRETLPTIKYLLKKHAKVIVITHLGRPEGKVVDSLKLDTVAHCLQKLLKKKVHKLHACIGKSVELAIKKMKTGEIILLENIRFRPEEEKCEEKFSKELANLGDIFVNDAFAACHRAHGSTYGIAKYLPSYAGFLVEAEVKNLSLLLKNVPKPLTLIIGGAKIDTKIGLIKSFLGRANYIVIGGALANTFLAAEGYDIGKSLYEEKKLETAREILMLAEKKHQKLILPEDVVVADEATEYAKTLDLPLEDVEGNMKILDLGSKTQRKIADIVAASKTVIWNGPVGLYEFTPFMSGTKTIAKTLAKAGKKIKSCIGGGDTIDALQRVGVPRSKFTFVSTGGGAMLEFLEGKKLPGIQALTQKRV